MNANCKHPQNEQPRLHRLLKHCPLKPLTVSALVSLISSEALAISAPFVAKGKDFLGHLVLIGKTCVGIAIVMALLQALSNKGPNWRWIGAIAVVGAALTGLQPILNYLTT